MGESADAIRRFLAVANQHDPDGVTGLCDPEVEFTDIPELPDSMTYGGRDGVSAWFSKVWEISDDLRFEIWELEENGDAVLVETSAEMHGKASGAEVGWRFWTVWRVRDGLITYHHGYSSREDARQDFQR